MLGESLIETDYGESTLMAICSVDGSQTSYFKPAQLIYRAKHIITTDGSLWCGVHSFGLCVCVHAFKMGLLSKAKDGCSQRQHLNLQSNSKMLFSPFLSNRGKLGGNQEKNRLACLSCTFI